jgi:hypothetical protein
MPAQQKAIRPRDRDTIIQSLGAGVVPRLGLQYLQVGRTLEVNAILKDIERISDGGSAFRFIIGEYGSGKTFFLNLVRAIALEKRLVTAHADLGPSQRLWATGGQARLLYAETIKNLATRSKSDGGALENIIEVFIAKVTDEAGKVGKAPEQVARQKLEMLRGQVGGFDFATVISAYLKGAESGNDDLKTSAIRWLRGEFTTRMEAKAALGVREIVTDSSIYNQWKLVAQLCRLAGYAGLLIVLDEMVNIYKLQNVRSRESNYEQLFHMLNDSLQGQSNSLGFVLGGTSEFLRDPRRGVLSYGALKTRLADNSFATEKLVDVSGPVIQLQNLSREELFVLLENIRKVFAAGGEMKFSVPDDALNAFMEQCEKKLGDSYFRTPRLTVKQFVNFLSVLEQNPQADWKVVLGKISPEADVTPGIDDIVDESDELTPIKLK